MKNTQNIIIVILVTFIIIFAILLILQITNTKKVDLETCEVNSNISKDTIYQEVYTEIMQGKEEYIYHTKDGKRQNNSEEMKATKVIEGAESLEVEGLNIEAENGTSVVTATIRNLSEETSGDFLVSISILDSDKREVIELGAYVNAVEAGETTIISTSTTIDIANAYSYTAKIK